MSFRLDLAAWKSDGGVGSNGGAPLFQTATGSLTTCDDSVGPVVLHAVHWSPPPGAAVRGLIFLSHGICEHLHEGYARLAAAHAANGFYVFGHDHLGHGRSSGEPRVYASSLGDYTRPLVEHCRRVRETHARAPLFALGHSMGGLVALMAAIDEQNIFDGGLILVAPLVEVDPAKATPTKVFLVKILSHIVPWWPVGSIETSQLSRDPAALEAIRTDPLISQSGLRSDHSCVLLQGVDELNKRFHEFTLPIYVQHGECDSICMVSGSRRLVDSVSSDRKELRIYPGAFHNVIRETQETVADVIKDQSEWIDKIVASK